MESMQRRVISKTLLVFVLAAMTLLVSLLAGSIVREDEEGHGRDGAAPGRRTASASQKCLVTIAA